MDSAPAILHGDARSLPLPDDSVDLIACSPPYYQLRAYTDGGVAYDGQIGAEPTPQQYIDALIDCTREWMRVLKPSGSLFVNLGDVYSSGQRLDSEFTVEDAAWLAGVIDSDGSISIRVDNAGRSHVAWVRVGQMKREIVERIGQLTGTGQVWQDKRGVWNWNAAAQQAKWVLERIWPWLQIKRRQALAAVELMACKAARGRRGRWNPLTDDDIAHRERIRQAVLAWNSNRDDDYEPDLLSLPALPKEPRWVPPKSLLLLPERYAVACVDQLGLIHRAEIVWDKPSALPESVTDRVRRSHELIFHFTKQRRYFSAVDEIREPHQHPAQVARDIARGGPTTGSKHNADRADRGVSNLGGNPLGKLPGSVWSIASQPLRVPAELDADHFAAWPMAIPRRLITGWCPREVCTACGEGRRPVLHNPNPHGHVAKTNDGQAEVRPGLGETSALGLSRSKRDAWRAKNPRTITGCACACSDTSASSTPGVVLDPFGGTGTTALVAAMHGRIGISLDASADYGRIAEWRCNDPKERARAAGLDPDAVAAIRPEIPGQGSLLDLDLTGTQHG